VSLARTLLLAAIRSYRRHVSPHKGFACAYRVHAGGCSCSTLGLRAIARYGAWRGLGVLRLRLEQCHLVACAQASRPVVARRAQAGFVECIACDGGCIDGGTACDAISCGLDTLSCLDCGDSGGCGKPFWSGSRRSSLRPRGQRAVPRAREPGSTAIDDVRSRGAAPPP